MSVYNGANGVPETLSAGGTAFWPVTDLRQVGEEYQQITLSWSASEGAVGYKVSRDGVLASDQAATAYTDIGLLPGESHSYTVVAYNSEAVESDPVTITASTKFSYYYFGPEVVAAFITPNPVEMNVKCLLSVSVEERLTILEPTCFYSGEIFAGEV